VEGEGARSKSNKKKEEDEKKRDMVGETANTVDHKTKLRGDNAKVSRRGLYTHVPIRAREIN